jgi:hypothetical protein
MATAQEVGSKGLHWDSLPCIFWHRCCQSHDPDMRSTCMQTIIDFEARYPMMGGWKADFKLGMCDMRILQCRQFVTVPGNRLQQVGGS